MSAPRRIDYRRAAVGLRARWLYASGAAVALMALAISSLALAEISNQPLYLSSNVDPNIMLIIDDSGSMDSEVLLPTNDGALWWHTGDKSFVGRNRYDVTTSGGVLNYNKTGSADGTWKKYVYLFPNGTGDGNRKYSDSTNDHYAIPPIGPFAYLRSSDYNGVYYNPTETYEPWVSSGTYTFSNAASGGARSDPALGTGTLNLGTDLYIGTDNWKFRFQTGMVIPKNTVYDGKTADNDTTVGSTNSLKVQYYPATYYLKTSTGTYSVQGSSATLTGSCGSPDSSHYTSYEKRPSTFSSSDADALAPDGYCLKRYEIKDGNTFPSGRTYAQEMQNFANWFTYYRKRHLSLRGGAGKAFEDIKDVRVGGFTINDINEWPNDLHGMWDIDANRANFYSFLYTAVGSGGTPNREALKYAGRQFNENTSVITQKCQLNFALLCTDGFATLWTGASVANADGGKGSPYEDEYSNTLADIAMYYYSNPLRSDDFASGWVPTPSACGKAGTPAWVDCNDDLHMVTFGVTLGAVGNIFGTTTHLDVDDAYKTPYPTWADPNLERSPVQVDDLYHATINARGEMFSAKNPAELQKSLSDALSQMIGRQVSTAASIATNTTRLGTDTMIYQAKFNSDDWSGQLVAYMVNADGSVGDVAWDSDTADQIPSHASRHIYTWKGSTGSADPVGLEFTAGNWNYLPSDQQTALIQTDETADDGKARINWIRGDDSVTLSDDTPLRSRAKLLGDIVNSDPAFVGKSNFRYDRLPVEVDGQSTYLAFQTGTSSRRKMLYLGANDGMLHGFDAETGVEQFAYIPKGVFSNLASLTDPGYSHSYFVDGSPYVGDAYLYDTNTLNYQWKTVLVGSTGAGGRSVFALDVTYLNLNSTTTPPSYEPASDYFNATKVLWEFTDEDLGYTIGQPVVGRLPTGQWVAIFGNGYDSDNHRAFLFIVDLATGARLAKIDTETGTSLAPNGLATPALIADSNRTIQYAYAGDLLGNLWKFDLTSDNISNPGWNVEYAQGGNPAPLFTARNDADQVQPITAPLEVLAHSSGGYLVLFGTGKYFEVGDNVISTSPPIQSFYGILDGGARITTTNRSELQEQEITHELTVSGAEVRVTTQNTVDYTVKSGWYMDLVTPTNVAKGERVVSSPLIRSGRIIFTTLIPSLDPCEYGGTSWLMELDADTGARLDYSVFDLGGDHLFNTADYVTVTIDGEEVKVPASGLKSEVGIIKTPAIISAGEVEYKFFGGSTGEISSVNEVGSAQSGRQSWRQIQ